MTEHGRDILSRHRADQAAFCDQSGDVLGRRHVEGRIVDVDPLRRRLLWQQVRKLGHDGVSVLLVTHNVLEAEHSVDRLAVIDRGRILDQGTPSSLKAEDRGHLRLQLKLTPDAGEPEASRQLSQEGWQRGDRSPLGT